MIKKKTHVEGPQDRAKDAPNAISEFVLRMARRTYRGTDQRSEPRYIIALPIVVQPLNDAHEPVGAGFKAILRDISAHGAGLLHTRFVRSQFLALELKNSNLQPPKMMHVVLKVLRCEPAGPMYDIGGEFVGKLGVTVPEEEARPH